MCVRYVETDSLAPKPVTNVVSVAVVQRHSYRVVEDHLEIWDERWISKVSRPLESVRDVIVGVCVIQVDAQSLLCRRRIQEV